MNDGARPATALWRDALAQVDVLLAAAPPERERALADLEETRPQVHALVAALLKAGNDADARGFLEPQTPHGLRDGAALGPYRIVSQLGAGGMGEVWLARRSDGLFEGEVAIKTLLPFYARGALRERFLREAQLLGRISHPNIARLLDAGVSETGAVYLVLEYVRGIPLDRYCEERRLDLRARLGLFLAACNAVAHAHANLIVHRDLKPSNILVNEAGEVKLLDFGVATLLEQDAAASSDLTRLTGRLFTPEYAAPEQLRGDPVSTGTDVYALGVILYQLLTGRRPHEATERAALEQAVLHDDAPLASRAVGDDAKLRRELAGDLDNIVARALEKKPADRYAGVADLAADVIRHLRHLPVRARTATFRYRAAKFLRRNRVPVALGASAVVALCAGVVLALWQADVARDEARKATAIRDFLVGVFERNSVAHPDGAQARKVTAEELLAQSAREIRAGLEDSPEVRAELMGVMSRLYARLDLQKPAIELLTEKLAITRAAHGARSIEVARTLSDLGYSQSQIGDYEAAESSSKEALGIFTELGDETSLERVKAHSNLGQAGYRLGRGAEVVTAQFRTALALVQKHHPRDGEHVSALLLMARAMNLEQKHEEAVRYCERALALVESKTVEVDGITKGTVLQTLGYMLSWVHRYEESEKYTLRALAEYDRAGGPDHPFSAEGRRELGSTYMWQGRRADAKKLMGESLLALERTKGPDDPELTSHVRISYASTMYLRGELAEAEPQMTRAYAALKPGGGALLLHARLNLGRLFTQQGRFAEAREYLANIEEDTAKAYGKGSWMHGTALLRAGELELAQGHDAEARALLTRLWTEFTESPDALTNNRAGAGLALVRLDLAAGDVGAARDRATQLHDDIERSKGRREMPDESASASMLLGAALLAGGDAAAARPHLEKAVSQREEMDAAHSLWLAEARLYLAQALRRLGDRAGALRQLELAQAAHRAQPRVGPQYARQLAAARTQTT